MFPTSHLRVPLLFVFAWLIIHAGPVFSQSQTITSEYAVRFVPSPSRQSLSFIQHFKNGEALAAGRYLARYRRGTWTIVPGNPLRGVIDAHFTEGNETVWMSSARFPYSSSWLFMWHEGILTEVPHPLANEVKSIFQTPSGTFFIGGDREIAVRIGTRWRHLPYPPIQQAILQIFGTDQLELWGRTSADGLYHCMAGQWIEELPGRRVRFAAWDTSSGLFVLTGDSILYRDHAEWTMHSRDSLLHRARSIVLVAGGPLLAIGAEGFAASFANNRWTRIPVPFSGMLFDASFATPDTGWICGENGVLMTVSRSPVAPTHPPTRGFVREIPIAIEKETHDQYGVAIDDFTGDGRNDVFAVALNGPHQMFVNLGSSARIHGTPVPGFREEAFERNASGFDDRQSPQQEGVRLFLGAAAGDVENDGDQDLFICSLNGLNLLLLNDGSGHFRDVSDQPDRAQGEGERSNGAALADADLDGDLDLFVTNEYASNRFYLNDGTGYFSDATDSSGLSSPGGSMSALWADLDADGLPDLVVSNWARNNSIYRNCSDLRSGVRFEDVSLRSNAGGIQYQKANGIASADLDNDGDPDLVITRRGLPVSILFNTSRFRFEEADQRMMPADSLLAYGVALFDADNDGWVDILMNTIGGNVLWENQGGTRFTVATLPYGAESEGYGTGTAAGDIDGDGDVDFYSAVFTGGSSSVFVNSVNDSNFLVVTVEGSVMNRDGTGAIVRIIANDPSDGSPRLIAMREIQSGGSYCSRNAREAHFGIPAGSVVDVHVLLPGGRLLERRSIRTPARIHVREEEGAALAVRRLFAWSRNSLVSRERRAEMIKVFVVLTVVAASAVRSRKRFGPRRFIVSGMHIGGAAVFLLIWWLTLFQGFFVSLIAPLAVMVFLGLAHLAWEHRSLKRSLERQRTEMRTAIARDLHDDLATSISSGMIYADALDRALTDATTELRFPITKIRKLFKDISDSTGELIWTVSPAHDSLEDLCARVAAHLRETCAAHGMTVRVSVPSVLESWLLTDEEKRNLHLIVKEWTANVVKHAHATEVRLLVTVEKRGLTLHIQDDGVGISREILERSQNTSGSLHGHGIPNIRQRAASIGATLMITSPGNRGTALILNIKLTHLRH